LDRFGYSPIVYKIPRARKLTSEERREERHATQKPNARLSSHSTGAFAER
jgi:hypothetical protein